jgi:predicted RNase H-like nuclease
MKHITTFSGEDFTPLSPKIEQIKIIDIAHALSMLCRANGHFERFYSVGQHSINCAIEAESRGFSKEIQLACLLHDASEAYLSDMTRPVKNMLADYLKIEDFMQSMIYEKYLPSALSDSELSIVKAIDDDMLVCEFNALMKKKVFESNPTISNKISFETKDFIRVEKQFINLFNCLTDSPTNTSYFPNKFLSVGIDGCKGKWLAVALTATDFELKLFDDIESCCNYFNNADSIIIDMPIGLPEKVTELRPDAILRNQLKGKASSVFNTPCRQAVYEETYEKANETNIKVLEKGLSKQSFAITSKIREIDEFLQGNPNWKNRLIESHPEYCFKLLNNGVPVVENKQTIEGQNIRLSLLSEYLPICFELVSSFRLSFPRLSNKLDDLFDALVLAVTGAIGLKNGFVTLPEIPQKDQKGIAMQIVSADINKGY